MVGLSPFWLLFFDDILAITETVAGGGFCFLNTRSERPHCQQLSQAVGQRPYPRTAYWQMPDWRSCANRHAIDATSITNFNAPELYLCSFTQINTRFASVEEEVMESRYDCGPWVSPVPLLPRLKQFSVTQLVLVQCSAAKFKRASERQDQGPPWTEVLIVNKQGRKGDPAAAFFAHKRLLLLNSPDH